ncbi:MAG: bifunctional DNA-formamidopyrimidine glycosylase/DNA-(apurinic or apyrimidinic site) lyase [Alphaproteobacteria bacterium]|nr:bifunctional DNA-formamidopyrimidine glycosylase/DNA-(apurinic or apyrimidinic site) lyase [Alphaproteobacteria bacterium]MDP6516255.1 bifunctional DNA-formamidopyrimidine glycosylase/DNA-(apurinic or apyrimidinic site) lyase [Alphaproteobacteria bacterium]
MPELPEVETIRRGLIPVLEGRRLAGVVVRRRDLRVPVPRNFASRLTGRRIARIERRAKYLLLYLDDATVLLIHLGMSGRMGIGAGDAGNGAHDHVIFDTDDGARLVFNDPRRFGLMALCREQDLADHRLIRNLGPEPLGNRFNGPVLSAALAGRRAPIKALLLDQGIVAGLGNIYVCESLFRAALSPRRTGASVAGVRAERLVAAIRAVLAEAIAAGGSSLRDYVQASGELGYFQHRFAVYHREDAACVTGKRGHTVRRIIQSNRATFYCPNCQR